MAHTVKKVAAMSGVSVRTLHFYDEIGLLKPAYTSDKGYRFYEEPQLLTLQQILFYRELGLELKQVKRILGRRDFEKVAALKSHRKVLQKKLARTKTLVETIDKTINHLKGKKKMKSKEMFAGFSVAAGKDRFGEQIKLAGEHPVDCKVSGKDTDGAMSVFEITVGWPRHRHHDQDEWIYVIDGHVSLEIAGQPFRLSAGESIFIPRNVAHAGGGGGKVLNVYQPAGQIEEFFRELGTLSSRDIPSHEQVINKTYTDEQVATLQRLFGAHGMDLLPPVIVEFDGDQSR